LTKPAERYRFTISLYDIDNRYYFSGKL